MQQALRPYMTTGIAVVSAGTLLAAPVLAPTPLPDIQAYAIELTAALDPIDVYSDLALNTFTNVSTIGGEWLDAPFPVLQAIISNQIGYITDVVSGDLPIWDVPGEMFGNAGAVFAALSNFMPSFDINILVDSLTSLLAAIASGDPLAEGVLNIPPAITMGLATLGPLVTGGAATFEAVGALQSALTNNDYLGALGTLVASPGFIADGLLNQQIAFDINLPEIFGHSLGNVHVPLFNGLLQPTDFASASLADLFVLRSSELTGLTNGFVNYLPGVIAAALGGETLFGAGGTLGDLPLNLGNLLDFGDILGVLSLDSLITDLGLGSVLGGLTDVVPGAAGDISTDLVTSLLGGLLGIF